MSVQGQRGACSVMLASLTILMLGKYICLHWKESPERKTFLSEPWPGSSGLMGWRAQASFLPASWISVQYFASLTVIQVVTLSSFTCLSQKYTFERIERGALANPAQLSFYLNSILCSTSPEMKPWPLLTPHVQCPHWHFKFSVQMLHPPSSTCTIMSIFITHPWSSMSPNTSAVSHFCREGKGKAQR